MGRRATILELLGSNPLTALESFAFPVIPTDSLSPLAEHTAAESSISPIWCRPLMNSMFDGLLVVPWQAFFVLFSSMPVNYPSHPAPPLPGLSRTPV